MCGGGSVPLFRLISMKESDPPVSAAVAFMKYEPPPTVSSSPSPGSST
jgi:hypothetical protein